MLGAQLKMKKKLLVTMYMCYCEAQSRFVVRLSNYVRSRLTVTELVAKIIPYCHSMKTLISTILLLSTLSICALGQKLNSKRKFNGILIGQEKYILSPQKLDYEHKFKKKSNDSTIYRFVFEDVESLATRGTGTEMLVTKDQVFIGASFVGDNQFEKLMDFGLKPGERWTVANLFCFRESTITFELKYFDNIPNDTIYQFKIDGVGICSHTEPVKRIYGSKKLGLVRLDYVFQPSFFHTNIYDRAIFVSSDYLRRGKLKSSYSDGLIKDPR